MDYRERMALDELLKGITGEDTDGGIVVNNNTQWKAPPSPDINTVSVVTSCSDIMKYTLQISS